MNAQATFSAQFSAALLAPEFSPLPGLKTWNGSDPAGRFAVYRNNVLVSLIDALADTYPVVQALVGEDFFRAMAAEFVRFSPPRSPVLAWYGGDFSGFVADFPPARGLPYLADVARLECLRVESWHAADAPALVQEDLAALLSDEVRLPDTRFSLNPGLRVMHSEHPVVSLWAAHQEDDPSAALASIVLDRAESALLLRPQLGVEIILIEAGAGRFIENLRARIPFAESVTTAGAFDLPATLGLLIGTGALAGILPMENPS